ncbi:MAG: hypothetical protein EOM12_14395, partial [Verrucomicrobiae bacterium]|nr:hypothetical protein [Verrucomicrobiae bacterium]
MYQHDNNTTTTTATTSIGSIASQAILVSLHVTCPSWSLRHKDASSEVDDIRQAQKGTARVTRPVLAGPSIANLNTAINKLRT